jgi:hypothetical protein
VQIGALVAIPSWRQADRHGFADTSGATFRKLLWTPQQLLLAFVSHDASAWQQCGAQQRADQTGPPRPAMRYLPLRSSASTSMAQ